MKKVVLVGHCGPDSSYLRMSIGSAVPATKVIVAQGEADLQRELADGADLLLLNRILEYGYAEEEGVDLLRRLRQSHPGVKAMMVSNFPDAQAAAVAEGALPGFGKRDLGSAQVKQLLQDALERAAV